jgi:WD40 repeat protein
MIKYILIITLFLGFTTFGQKPRLVIKSGLGSGLNNASISEDEKLLLTSEDDGIAILWNLQTGAELSRFENTQLACFTTGNFIVTIDTKYGFHRFDLNQKELKYVPGYDDEQFRKGELTKPTYDHRFKVLRSKLKSYDLEGESYPKSASVNAYRDAYKNTTFLEANNTVPNVYDFDVIKVTNGTNTTTNKISFTLRNRFKLSGRNDVSEAIVSPNELNAVAYHEDCLEMRSTQNGKLIYRLEYNPESEGDRYKIQKAVFSPDNKYLGIIGSEHFFLFDIETGKELWKVSQRVVPTNKYDRGGGMIEFTPKGVLFGYERALVFTDLKTGAFKTVINGFNQQQGYELGLLEVKKELILNERGNIYRWNLQSGGLESYVKINNSDSAPVSFDKTGNIIYAGFNKYDQNGEKIGYMRFVKGESQSVDKRFDIHIENGGAPNYVDKVLIRDLLNPNPTAPYFQLPYVQLADFAKTKAEFALKMYDPSNVNNNQKSNKIDIYSTLTKAKIKSIIYPIDELKRIKYSETDRFLLLETNTGYRKDIGGKLLLLNIENNQPDSVLTKEKIYTTAFSANDKKLYISTSNYNANGNISVYDIAQKQMTGQISVGQSYIQRIQPLKDNRHAFVNTFNQSEVFLIDVTTNEVLATLYLIPGTTEWAVVTPNGQFDASPAMQKDIYFVKGTTVFPLETLYEKHYTPKLLTRLLAGERFGPIEGFDNLKQPPTVKLKYKSVNRNLTVDEDVTTFENTTGIAEIMVEAQSADDVIDEIRLFHNGKIVNLATRGLFVDDAAQKQANKTYTINLTEGSNQLRAMALNSQRTESSPEEIRILYKSSGGQPINPTPNNSDEVVIEKVDKNATMHLIVVGINQYQNPKMSLNYALADATAFKTEVEKDAKSLLATTKVYFVTDAQANKKGIEDAFKAVKATAKPQDVLVFYYAGHGVISEKNKEFYLVPTDVADLRNVDAQLAEKGIPSKLLQGYAVDIQAQKQLFILDACQSAGAFESLLKGDAEQQKSLALVARSTGTHWLAASGSQQFANEFASLGHGVFTYVLLEALKGKASVKNMITVNGLKNFLQVQVPELMKKYNGSAQYPASYGSGNDFPVEMK